MKQLQVDIISSLLDLGEDHQMFYDAEIGAIYRKYVIYKYMGKPVPSIKSLAMKIGRHPDTVSKKINQIRKQLEKEGTLIPGNRRTRVAKETNPHYDTDMFCRNYIAKIRYGIRISKSSTTEDGQEVRDSINLET